MDDDLECGWCGVWPKLAVDADGKPIGPVWVHADWCERTEAEERRLRSAVRRGEDPAGMMYRPGEAEER